MGRRRFGQPILERLKERTRYVGECWLHQGSPTTNGYVQVWYDGRLVHIHRISAHLFHGLDLRSKLQANHECPNRNCWNPEHIYVGTQADNITDYLVLRCQDGRP